MSSTNKTTNFKLSQFAQNDCPKWQADYNVDMEKIDAMGTSCMVKIDAMGSNCMEKIDTMGSKIDAMSSYCIGKNTEAEQAISAKVWPINTLEGDSANYSNVYNGIKVSKSGIYEITLRTSNAAEPGTWGGCDWDIKKSNQDLVLRATVYLNAQGFSNKCFDEQTVAAIAQLSSNEILTVQTSAGVGNLKANRGCTLFVRLIKEI